MSALIIIFLTLIINIHQKGSIMEQEIEQYIEYIGKNNKKSENTLVSYRRDLYKLMHYLTKELALTEWPQVTETDLNSYVLHLQSEESAPSAIARYIVSMKAFFEYLEKTGRIDEEPAMNIRPPRHEKKVPGIISVENVVKLLTAPDGDSPKQLRDRAMLELLYATGIKVSELVAIRMTDINLQVGYVSCQTVQHDRIIPFGNEAKQALMRYLKDGREALLGGKDSEYLFTNMKGEQMSRQGFWKIIKAYAKKAGIEEDITPYTLRHSFAAHMISNGADIYAVSEMLGHLDVSATQVYAVFSNSRLRDVYTKAHPRG